MLFWIKIADFIIHHSWEILGLQVGENKVLII